MNTTTGTLAGIQGNVHDLKGMTAINGVIYLVSRSALYKVNPLAYALSTGDTTLQAAHC